MLKSLLVSEIAQALSCTFEGENRKVKGVSPLKNATEEHISFLSNNKYRKFLSETNAGACLVKASDAELLPQKVTRVICDDPYLSYAYVLDIFFPDDEIKGEIASTASIAPSAKIGKNCIIQHNALIDEEAILGDNTFLGPSTYLGKNVIIGKNCYIAHNVTLANCEIGSNCVIHSGVRIGQDGFGFTLDESKKIKKIKQVGKVIIGNDVEIGSNTCIDRGALENTFIGDNTKIDNLVQIGHNVVVGKNCFICGQAGIAGSTVVGDYVMIGGQAGISGHLEIGRGVQIAGQSGVASDLKDGEKVGGYPATNITDWHRQSTFLKKMITKKQ